VSAGWTVANAIERLPAARLATAGSGGAGSGRASGGAAARGAASAKGDGSSSSGAAVSAPARPATRPARRERLSKDAYRRQKAQVDADLSRLGLRRSHLELAMGDPNVSANFVEMRRIASELADVEQALAAAEDAWLELEERAP
jgi:hypothetical protein